mmetsp:Transcript_10774/g.45219  ORF Transcript_10774/g.45219 Transcript_10774/m.45219 type:complete len:239 (+) Transcript_10774:3071-3787(+)
MSIWNASMLSSRCCIHCVCWPRHAPAEFITGVGSGGGSVFKSNEGGMSMDEGMGACVVAAGVAVGGVGALPSSAATCTSPPSVPVTMSGTPLAVKTRFSHSSHSYPPPCGFSTTSLNSSTPTADSTITAPTQTSPSDQVSRAASSGFQAPRDLSEPTTTRLNPKSRLACTANATVVRVAAPGAAGTLSGAGAAGTFSGAGAFWSCALATTEARRAVSDRVRVALGRAPSAVAARSTPG